MELTEKYLQWRILFRFGSFFISPSKSQGTSKRIRKLDLYPEPYDSLPLTKLQSVSSDDLHRWKKFSSNHDPRRTQYIFYMISEICERANSVRIKKKLAFRPRLSCKSDTWSPFLFTRWMQYQTVRRRCLVSAERNVLSKL